MLSISGIYNNQNFSIKQINKKISRINFKKGLRKIHFKNLDIEYSDNDYSKCIYRKEKNIICIVVGEIYENQVVYNQISKSEYIYNIYKFKGLKYINDINGSFIFCIYDKNNFFLGKDYNSIIPCYYNYDGKTLKFSDDLKTILNPNLIDNLNLTNIFTPILCGGIYLDGSTFFKNTFKLEPGTCINVNKKKITINKFPYFSFIESNDKGIKYYIQNTLDLLENAIKLRTKKFTKVKLGLSGGVDSRIMLELLKRNFSNVSTFTYGTGSEFVENFIAKQISNIINVKHKYINIPRGSYIQFANNSLEKTNSILTTNMAPQLKIFNNFVDKNSCFIFGTFLDYLIGNSGYQRKIFNIKKFSELQNYYLNGAVVKYKKNEFIKFFDDSKVGTRIYDSIISSVSNSLKNIEYDNIPNLNNSFFFSNRGKRWHNNTLIPVIMKNQIIIPSYDKNFLDFISKIPIKYKKNDYFRLKLLEKINRRLFLIKTNKSMKSGKKTPYENSILIRKQKSKIYELQKKMIESNYKNKFSTDKFFDANFFEWIKRYKNFNKYFEKRLFSKSPLTKILNLSYLFRLFKDKNFIKKENFKLIILLADYQEYLRIIKKKI